MVRNIVLAFILVTSSMYLSGCFALLIGAAAGAGGVIWVKGKLQQDVNASLDKVYSATKTALKKMELPLIVDRKDKMTAKIESGYSDGKHVWIDLDHLSNSLTKISVRVGTLGDEARSRQILEKIMQYL